MEAEAKLEIGINRKGQAHIAFTGHEGLILSLVGTMEQVKVDLLARARKKFNMGLNWADDKAAKPKEELPRKKYDIYPNSTMLPRDKAIDSTLYAIEALQLRIEAMRKSRADQEFAVDLDLLSQL